MLAGCTSPPTAPPRTDGLAAGTAEIVLNGQTLPPSQEVDCTFIQSTTTITVGNQSAGTTIVINNATKLEVKSVEIRDLAGFTGSFHEDLGPKAIVGMTGRTFSITGIANGFDADKPSSRTGGSFSIKASC